MYFFYKEIVNWKYVETVFSTHADVISLFFKVEEKRHFLPGFDAVNVIVLMLALFSIPAKIYVAYELIFLRDVSFGNMVKYSHRLDFSSIVKVSLSNTNSMWSRNSLF